MENLRLTCPIYMLAPPSFSSYNISIHAPAKGATKAGIRRSAPSSDFNPRTREGCDAFEIKTQDKYLQISIHAPAKGATLFASVCNVPEFLFQSTHPRRVRPQGTDETTGGGGISIHAPAKGATAFKLAQSLSALSSIILRTD